MNPWDLIEATLLRATTRPSTAREVIAATGLPGDTVKGQLDQLRNGGYIVATIEEGVRYRATLAGVSRLAHLDQNTRTPALAKAA